MLLFKICKCLIVHSASSRPWRATDDYTAKDASSQDDDQYTLRAGGSSFETGNDKTRYFKVGYQDDKWLIQLFCILGDLFLFLLTYELEG